MPNATGCSKSSACERPNNANSTRGPLQYVELYLLEGHSQPTYENSDVRRWLNNATTVVHRPYRHTDKTGLEAVMRNSYGSNWNGEELSDAEVFAAIRYLDPRRIDDEPTAGDSAFVICFAIVVFAAACFALYSLCRLV